MNDFMHISRHHGGKLISLIGVFLKLYPERLEEFFKNPNMKPHDLEYLNMAIKLRDERKDELPM